MNQADILTQLQSIFETVFLDAPTVTASLTAADVPEWESSIHISLVLAIEEACNIRFRVGEVEKTANVGELADLILRRLREK